MLSNNKLILNSILAFSFLSLAIAYFIQYILGHEPCNLCLIERIPYLASLILISLIFIINKFEKVIASIVLLFFIFGSVVSFYHVGIEQGFFNESFVCDLGSSNVNMSKEDLLKQLQNRTPISCKDVTFRFFGLSLATINTVISILLSGIMFKVIKIMEKLIKNFRRNIRVITLENVGLLRFMKVNYLLLKLSNKTLL